MERERAIATLPEPYAQALRLHDLDDDEAISAQLGIEPEAVGPLLRLAEAKLTAILQPASASDDR